MCTVVDTVPVCMDEMSRSQSHNHIHIKCHIYKASWSNRSPQVLKRGVSKEPPTSVHTSVCHCLRSPCGHLSACISPLCTCFCAITFLNSLSHSQQFHKNVLSQIFGFEDTVTNSRDFHPHTGIVYVLSSFVADGPTNEYR